MVVISTYYPLFWNSFTNRANTTLLSKLELFFSISRPRSHMELANQTLQYAKVDPDSFNPKYNIVETEPS